MGQQDQRAVGQDEPVMIAWNRHKATEDYANTLRWAGKANEGQLWACFAAGFGSGLKQGPDTSAEVASIAGELIKLDAADLDTLDIGKGSLTSAELLAKIRKLAASALGQRQ
jgi:hypothetical protein